MENEVSFSIDDFNLNFEEGYRKEMLGRIQDRKAMFTKYLKNKQQLEQIKAEAKIANDTQKEALRERFKKIEAEQKEWTDLIVGLKAKDKRKSIINEYTLHKEEGVLFYRLMEYNNKTNFVRVISKTTTPPKGWTDKMRYLTVEN